MKKRQLALNELMKVGEIPYRAEGDFFSNFLGYFSLDIKCLCENLNIKNSPGIFHIDKKVGGGKAGQAYELDMLENHPNKLAIKLIEIPILKDYLSVRTVSINESDKLINPSNSINCWKNQKEENRIIVVSGTDFSNQTCIHLILNTILREIPNYIYQYDAFICNKGNKIVGYNIMELADMSLDTFIQTNKVSNQVLDNIIKQVFYPLSILKKSIYGFSHSDLKPKNVFVKMDIEPIFKIADYDKSSITWNSVRFYNGTKDADSFSSYTNFLKFNNFDIKNIMENNTIEHYYTLYTRGGEYGTLQLWTMHNQLGVPLSYDFYTFMIITLLLPEVWNFIQNNDNNIFMKLWKYMWYEEDYKIIMDYIIEKHEKYKILKGKEDRENYLDKMQSIGELNKFLGSSNIRFKYEIAPFFEIIGIPFVDDIPDKKLYFVESDGGKICFDKCVEGKCKTNKYSTRGYPYEWDNCSN